MATKNMEHENKHRSHEAFAGAPGSARGPSLLHPCPRCDNPKCTGLHDVSAALPPRKRYEHGAAVTDIHVNGDSPGGTVRIFVRGRFAGEVSCGAMDDRDALEREVWRARVLDGLLKAAMGLRKDLLHIDDIIESVDKQSPARNCQAFARGMLEGLEGKTAPLPGDWQGVLPKGQPEFGRSYDAGYRYGEIIGRLTQQAEDATQAIARLRALKSATPNGEKLSDGSWPKKNMNDTNQHPSQETFAQATCSENGGPRNHAAKPPDNRIGELATVLALAGCGETDLAGMLRWAARVRTLQSLQVSENAEKMLAKLEQTKLSALPSEAPRFQNAEFRDAPAKDL